MACCAKAMQCGKQRISGEHRCDHAHPFRVVHCTLTWTMSLQAEQEPLTMLYHVWRRRDMGVCIDMRNLMQPDAQPFNGARADGRMADCTRAFLMNSRKLSATWDLDSLCILTLLSMPQFVLKLSVSAWLYKALTQRLGMLSTHHRLHMQYM